ncbi:hypothetical protein [Breoghania sp. L-A4]|uniref:hypothetical protein n=1 Tax=Breoghania sp. L-A4 TaxID=2304600 RepID=UPI000E35AAC9|nr:hypothetical protein [Breoghania sp. L-A4]AXS39575.1 hypothetical protein D1F64_05300 [Breoghania sp. L-A4]
MKFGIFAFVFLSFLFSQAALAETYSRTVKPGRTSAVGGYSVVHSDTCLNGPLPRYRIKTAPEHGKVEFRKETWKFRNKSSRCDGKPVKGLVIYYTPNKGFRGKDSFKVENSRLRYSNGTLRVSTTSVYDITVK